MHERDGLALERTICTHRILGPFQLVAKRMGGIKAPSVERPESEHGELESVEVRGFEPLAPTLRT